MALGTDKLILTKNFLLGLSKRAKVFVIVGILFVIAGGTIVVISNNRSPSLSTIAGSSGINKQGSAKSSAVLAEADDNTSSQDNNDGTGNDQNATNSQQSQQNTAERTTATRSVGSAGQSSNVTPQPQSPPAAPKPDYNLNDVWYFAEAYRGGQINTCWPEPVTEENESQCIGGEIIDFVGIGIAKTALEADNIAINQVDQKTATAHADIRKGAGPSATLLTEALCTQYSLSCGRW